MIAAAPAVEATEKEPQQTCGWTQPDGTTMAIFTAEQALERVEATFKELGFGLNVMRHLVFLRTDAIADRTAGGIILPQKKTRFYEGLPHLRLVTGIVVAIGPKVYGVKVGDRIAFKRLKFMWHWKLQDGTYVGHLPMMEITGLVEGTLDVQPYD